MRRLALLLLTTLLASSAHAETRRIAVVVGNNAGSGELPPLRFAETDAGKMARTLVEVGDLAADDLFLLQGRTAVEVERAIALASDRIAEFHRRPDARALLLFYFSGHSDGEALELGRERLAFGRLKSLLAASGAEVRVAIIDACRSGAAIGIKGGRPAPAFSIRLADELSTKGEAILTSSAADEVALESREVMGSYFTHHLVSGLRGAADTSGDGQVTLGEAYRHAYERTLAASAATLGGTQHPVYDFRLSGQGELVLASLTRQSSGLSLPDGFERALITDLARDQVVAELAGGGSARVALAPGSYGVRLFRNGEGFGGRFGLEAGAVRAVDWSELKPLALPEVAGKGAASTRAPAPPSPSPPVAVDAAAASAPKLAVAGVGLAPALADALDVAQTLRLGFQPSSPSGASFALVGLAATGYDLDEAGLQLRAGWTLGFGREVWQLFVAAELGPGATWQWADGKRTHSALGFYFGPRLGLRRRLVGPLRLSAEVELMGELLRVDGEIALRAVPAALVGVAFDL